MAGAPKGNKNAQKHGFYASTLSDRELKLYEQAKVASLGDELAVMRVKLHGLLEYMNGDDNKVPEGTLYQMDRMVARVGDLEVKRSIIDRNNRADGVEEDESEVLAAIQKHAAHRWVHKPKANGKAKNGSHR